MRNKKIGVIWRSYIQGLFGVFSLRLGALFVVAHMFAIGRHKVVGGGEMMDGCIDA